VKYVNTLFTFIFLASILIEAMACQLKGKKWYRLNDSIASLATFYSTRPITLFFTPFVVLAYDWISTNYGLFKIEMSSSWHLSNLSIWFSCIVAADLSYYWMHRALHNNRFLWCFHVTHHSSDELNLSVAPRKNWLSKLTYVFFYLPLPLIGYPSLMILLSVSVVSIYQFFIHTQFSKSIPFLQLIFCTPSHHRLHHAVNPQYIDRNYAGIFIIWDRLFGSFVSEQEPPLYGILTPPNSFNLLKVCFGPFSEYFKGIRRPRIWRSPYHKYQTTPTRRQQAISLLFLILAIITTTWYLDHQSSLLISHQIAIICLTLTLSTIATL